MRMTVFEGAGRDFEPSKAYATGSGHSVINLRTEKT